MNLVINGEMRWVDAPLSAESLLERLGLGGGAIAVEVNLQVIPRAKLGSTPLKEGDRIEIVTFVGGG